MKVLNLRCAYLHDFEGWFGSEDDFQSQRQRGLVACPFCADSRIQKMPTAPRLNLGGLAPNQAIQSSQLKRDATQPAPDVAGQSAGEQASAPSVLANPAILPGTSEPAAFLAALRQVMAATEDVGSRFAEEARRMHYGEAPARSIRGQASAREALEMRDEGIEVMPLPLPAAFKETLQ